jgi:hypothetical protein
MWPKKALEAALLIAAGADLTPAHRIDRRGAGAGAADPLRRARGNRRPRGRWPNRLPLRTAGISQQFALDQIWDACQCRRVLDDGLSGPLNVEGIPGVAECVIAQPPDSHE